MSRHEEMCALKRQCVDLVLACPFNRRDAACPFAEVRTHRDILTRVAWLKQRTVTEMRKFLVRHAACSQSGRTGEGRPYGGV